LQEDLEYQGLSLRAGEEHRQVLERKIQGYESKAIVDPRSMITFPKDLRNNLLMMMEAFKSTHEAHYIKSLVDPFHPDSQGARVPALLPRDTATFSTFNSYGLPS